MARIRTIKPEFFTSEDIVGLTPMARLLYIALWCEADREGRLVWKPKTFKLRYLPADNCDVGELCDELIEAGVVALYGDGLAVIPAFTQHQHINPREAASQLPDPDACLTRDARVPDASQRDSDVQGGREGKGKEGGSDASRDATRASPSGSRLPADWALPDDWRQWAQAERPDVDVQREADSFADYWHGIAGAKGRKADWLGTWRNWIRRANGRGGGGRGNAPREPTNLRSLTA